MPAVRCPHFRFLKPRLWRRSTFLMPTLLLATLLVGACDTEETPLSWQDLSGDEQTYVRRFVILERAKAVALNDRELGEVVLDSLATAWGDSAASEARALAPTDPTRSRLVNDFMLRVLEAEKDSLMTAPVVRRLDTPLPVPAAEATETEEEG